MAESPKFTVRPLSKQPRADLRESFRIYLSSASLLQCKLRVGDLCRIQAAHEVGRPITAIAWSAAEKIQDTVVQTSKLLQEVGGFKLGDKVYITKEPEQIADISLVRVEECTGPSTTTLPELAETERKHWEWSLEYPLSKAEVVAVGMVFEHDLKGCRRSFRVVDIEADDGLGSSKTIAQFGTTSKVKIGGAQKAGGAREIPTSLYVDTAGIGGLVTQIRQINERLRDFSLESQCVVMPSFYRSSGGILLHGPKGTGKTLLLSKVEACGWRKVFRVNSSVIRRTTGDSEASLRKTFAEALQNQPSLISLDQVDFIAPKRGSGDSSMSLAPTLCEGLDSLQNSQVLVVACTRHPKDVDDTLRTPHRLGTEIELPVPTANDRKEILYALRGSEVEPSDELLQNIASRTHGYVGADLYSLLQLACRKALTRGLSSVTVSGSVAGSQSASDVERPGQEEAPPIHVSLLEDDMNQALQETRPTAMREVFLETPQVKWKDIGGQHGIKKRLRKAVERPIKVCLCFPCRCCILLMKSRVASRTHEEVQRQREEGYLTLRPSWLLQNYVGQGSRYRSWTQLPRRKGRRSAQHVRRRV
jgi:AAA family ATPase